ncbi:S9 family peptidase [Neobacillus sp. D3-1R]|uniref:S9 family peptidase n=1 Tax=Neobacillus sp. D3-1R TaxID=3445778 RepID=UPI003FA11CE5
MVKRGMEPKDLYQLKSVANPLISPDGKKCLYVVTSMDEEKQAYTSNLFIQDLTEDTPAAQWTFGNNRNQNAKWSPNGDKIAFLSNRTGSMQIFLMSEKGGEARQLTFFENGVSHFICSPDGEKLAFSISLKEGQDIQDLEQKEKKKDDVKAKEVTALVVEQMKYKSDAEGFWKGTYRQIGIIDIATGDVEQLTSGKADLHLQCWSPDGTYIAVAGDLTENRDDSFLMDVFLLEVSTKELHKKTNSDGFFGGVTWSPNGRYLAMTGHNREFENATLTKLWIYDLEEDTHTCLTNEWDVIVGDYTIGDFQQGVANVGILWANDNHSFYFQATDNGNTALYYGNLNGEIYPALLDNQHVYGVSIDGNDLAVVAISKPDHPGDLYSLKITTGELKRLTNVNEKVLEEISLSPVESFEFESEGGLNVQGWLMYPANFNKDHKYPLLLEVHGGPHAMYGNSYMHEFQTLAAEGFAVLFTNPRGSHGYGQEFVNAVRGDYGGNDYNDLMNAVDFALEKFTFLDKDRMGVTGGSYGGFMTNWIVGHTDRFKAAVTQRSISNWISFYGVSDIGYYFTEWQVQSDLSDIQTLWKHSPLAYVDQVKTPLLILHSEKDYRCPIEQAEQLFIALKRQNKTTKFLRFPEANHELSRSGHPKLRLERLNAIKDWFNQYV